MPGKSDWPDLRPRESLGSLFSFDAPISQDERTDIGTQISGVFRFITAILCEVIQLFGDGNCFPDESRPGCRPCTKLSALHAHI